MHKTRIAIITTGFIKTDFHEPIGPAHWDHPSNKHSKDFDQDIPDKERQTNKGEQMAKIKNGSEVRLGKNRSVPIRYQGRTGFVVGKTQSKRGAQHLLVDLTPRRATPLAVNAKFVSAL